MLTDRNHSAHHPSISATTWCCSHILQLRDWALRFVTRHSLRSNIRRVLRCELVHAWEVAGPTRACGDRLCEDLFALSVAQACRNVTLCCGTAAGRLALCCIALVLWCRHLGRWALRFVARHS